MKMGRNQLILLGVAILVCVLLVLAPRVPSEKRELSIDPTESKVAEAVALVNGTQPMKGIKMLLDLAKENPENAELQWHLGQFSITSGQMDKAAARFERVVELNEQGFPDAHFILGGIYARSDSISAAIASFEQYKTLVKESDVMEDVDRILKDLKQQKAK